MRSWFMRKWYLDCVADDGTVWIGYRGDVRWGPVRVTFASSLLHDGSHSTTTTVLRSTPEPVQNDDGCLSWGVPSLHLGAHFSPRVPGVKRQLHSGVSWHCAIPSADAVVDVGGQDIRGRGYVEVLEMDVPPWRLPIDGLRWGRALTEGVSLTWIQWTGEAPLEVAVRDGAFGEVSEIGDESVRLTDGTRLTMMRSSVVREKSLARTLRPLGPVAAALATFFPGAVERKWLSRGRVTSPDRRIDEGWVIHELVTFRGD